MSEAIRFHLDENVDGAIAEGLRRRSIDVTTTPDVGLIGASDEEQVAFAHLNPCIRIKIPVVLLVCLFFFQKAIDFILY